MSNVNRQQILSTNSNLQASSLALNILKKTKFSKNILKTLQKSETKQFKSLAIPIRLQGEGTLEEGVLGKYRKINQVKYNNILGYPKQTQ